jgi:histidinol dehydrogenase
VNAVRFGPDATAAEVRALAPTPRSVENEVRPILDAVRGRGDVAVREYTQRFDAAQLAPEQLAVPAQEVEAALGTVDARVVEAMLTAIANVRAVAEAQLRDEVAVDLEAGQRVAIREQPIRRAAAYAPGGRAPYPSTVIMCAVTARVAGVDELAVCAPPGPEGRAHPLILAACTLCGVTEVYRMGGAQAIAALAYGTESVRPVDVIVGPGNAYVAEAKRQVAGLVGIDSIAGPSELVVVATTGADPEPIALDLLAQAEHGADSPVTLISPDPGLLDAVEERTGALDAPFALVQARDARAAVRRADGIAPEHLQLMGAEAEALADSVRAAGCLFVGGDAATAFGDYVAGSNHVLPTGGTARFASALSPATFRRRMARVTFPPGAAARLAPAGAALARAEGFAFHAESMERRA